MPVHLFVYKLTILMRKQKRKQGMWKVGEPRVRIDLAKNIMATPPKVRCKALCRSNAAACNATILEFAKSFFKKGSCVHLPYWTANKEA